MMGGFGKILFPNFPIREDSMTELLFVIVFIVTLPVLGFWAAVERIRRK